MEKGVPVQAPFPKKRRKWEKAGPQGAALPCELGLAAGGAAKPPLPRRRSLWRDFQLRVSGKPRPSAATHSSSI